MIVLAVVSGCIRVHLEIYPTGTPYRDEKYPQLSMDQIRE